MSYNIYEDYIRYITELDMSIINQTNKAKKLVKDISLSLRPKEIWMIKCWNLRFNLRSLVDFLYLYDMDVFDIEFGTVIRIYVCRKDDYRIMNSVVHSIKSQQ